LLTTSHAYTLLLSHTGGVVDGLMSPFADDGSIGWNLLSADVMHVMITTSPIAIEPAGPIGKPEGTDRLMKFLNNLDERPRDDQVNVTGPPTVHEIDKVSEDSLITN
jgi:hypothetical protein